MQNNDLQCQCKYSYLYLLKGVLMSFYNFLNYWLSTFYLGSEEAESPHYVINVTSALYTEP